MLWFVLLLIGSLGFLPFAALVAKLVLMRWRYRHIPSPKTVSFFLGHLYELKRERAKGRGRNYHVDELLLKWHSEVGGLFVVYLFTEPLVYVLDPADIQTVFTTQSIGKYNGLTKKFSYVFGERYFGDGLLCICDHDKWKNISPLYDQVFDKGFVENLCQKFCECTDAFIKKLQPLADGNTEVRMKKEIYTAAMDFVSKIFFSFDYSAEWKNTSLCMKRVKVSDVSELWDLALEGMGTGIFGPPFYKYLNPSKSEGYCEAARTLRMLGRECILKRKRALDKGEEVPNDMLTQLLRQSSKEKSDDVEHLVDNFINLHTGGFEPAASLLSFAVVLICQHEDVLEQILSEVNEVLGNRKEITIQDLDKLKYIEQVIEETARLYPPANPFSRKSPAGGVTLSGFFIPPGTAMNSPPGIISHMSQYFEDPERFKPSRFSPENKRPSPFVYFPFGIAHRKCKAQHFVTIMLKVVIARLFQVYTVTLPNGYLLEVEQKCLKRSQDDIVCTVTQRN